MLVVQIPKPYKETLKQTARRHDRTMSSEVRRALRIYFDVLTAVVPQPGDPAERD